MAQGDKHRCTLLDLALGETLGSPQQSPEKTSCSKSAPETAWNKNRGYLHGTRLKTFGRLYNEFLPTKRSIVQENGVRRAHEVPTRQGARPPPSWMPRVLPGLLLIFLFLYIPKRRKIAIRTVLESVYLPYHVPIPFWSLKRSGKCPLCIPPGLRFQ